MGWTDLRWNGASVGDKYPMPVGGIAMIGAVELVRPADTTPYAAKANISNSKSAPTVLTLPGFAKRAGWNGYIVSAQLMTDQKTNVAAYRLHVFTAVPAAVNDGALYPVLYTQMASRAGCIDFPACITEDATTSTAAYTARPNADGTSSPPGIFFDTAEPDGSLFLQLQTLTAFTPASGQKFRIELVAVPA